MTRQGAMGRFGAVAAAVTVAVSACSSTQSHVASAVTDYFQGVPKGVTVPADQQNAQTPWAQWASSRSIYVMTWGSGSCPVLPTSVEASGVGLVVLRTHEHLPKGSNACTADLAATTSVVSLPSDIDTRQALEVRIDGTSIRLPAYDAS